jgi:hypothetical protein
MEYFSFFMGCAFCVMGVVGFRMSRRHIADAERSVDWPRVHGVIVSSKVLLIDQSHLPSIEYRYEVDGRPYTGDSLTVGFSYSSSKTWAATFVTRYPAGTAVGIAVDPTNPATSALETGVRRHMYVPLFASILMTALGCASLYLQYSHHSKPVQQTIPADRSQH